MTQNNQTPWWRISDGAQRRAARLQQTQPAQPTFTSPIPPSTEVSQDPAYQSAISLAPPGPPWADMPVEQPAAQPNSVLPPDQRGATPSWLSDVANTLWKSSRILNPIVAATQDAAGMPADYGAQLADTFWSGNVPSGFAPADTWLGKAERNRAREMMTPLWKAQAGDVGGAISDSLKATAQGTVAGQGAAGIANLSGKIFNPQPGQEPVKFGDVAGAAMGALAMGPIGLAPKELMDVMNVAPQAAETLAGRLSASIPDTIQVGGVELPNPVKGSAFLLPSNAARFADAPLTYLDDLGKAITTGGTAAVARQFGMTGPKDIKTQAQEFQRTLGADLTAKWRGKNSAASDPAGAVESALLQDPVEYALWRTAPIAFSGPQAQLAAVKRILAGEDPQAVIKGEYPPAPDNELLVDESARFKELVDRHAEAAGVIAEQGALAAGQSYEEAQKQKLGADEAARYLVNQTRMIRGEELPLAELMGQTVVGFAMARLGLDPVNRIPFHEMFGLKNLIPSPKRPNILNQVYDSAAKAAGEDFTMGEMLVATKRGLSPEQVARADRAQATLDLAKAAKAPVVEGAPPRERTPNIVARAGANAYLQYINLVEFLPQAKAKMSAGYALDLIHTLTRESDNPLQVYETLKQWIIDPNSLKEPSGARPGFDTVPTSFKAELARPVIEGLGGGDKAAAIKVIEKLTAKMAKREEALLAEHNARPLTPEERATGIRVYTPEEQAKRFTSLGFLSDMAESLQKSAEDIHGVKPMKERAPLERWGAEVKSWLGEFYLRTLGYVFRNTMSDSVTMAMDGVFSFDGMKQIEAYMGKMQLTEDYIKAESQSEGSGGDSKFKKIPVIGAVQGWIGKNNQNWEVARRTRVFYNSFRQFMGLNWEPVLGVDVMQTLGPDLAPIGNALRDGWRSGQTVAEIRQTTQRLINGRTSGFNVVDIPTPPEFAKNISPEGQVRIRTEMQRVYDVAVRGGMAKDAAIKKATDEALSNYKGTATADYIRRMAALGKVVNPAPSSIRTFQEDQNEFEQRMTDLAKNTLPPGPERDALVEQIKGAYSEREQSVIAARDLVSKRLAGLPANASAESLAKLIVYAHESEHQTRNAARLAQDALVKEAWNAIAEMGKGGDKASRSSDMKAIWDKYRAGNDPVQQKMTADVAASYEWVANAIERIGADPTQFDAIIKERPDWVDKADWTEGVVRQAVAAMTRDDVSFETVVAMTRSGIDISRANAYALAKKLTVGDPTLTARVFDVLSQAERDIARQEVVTLSEIRLALARKDAGQITFDDYKNISDEKWKEYSDYARSRYNDYAMNSLTWVEIESGQLAKGLRDLGYTNEQIADLLKQAATKDNGAAIATIFEKAMPPGAPKPPTGKQPPPQQGDLPLDGGTPTPKTPPPAPAAPGGAAAPTPVAGGADLAPPNLRTPAAIAAEAKDRAARARDLTERAKINPTADNKDLAREANALADAAKEVIVLERMAARSEQLARDVPTEANKAKATNDRRIANESWLSYEQERLNPTPKPPRPPPTQGAGTGELPTAPGQKPLEQRVYEIVATTTGEPNAGKIAKTLRIGQAYAEKLIADAQARLAQEKATADGRAGQDAKDAAADGTLPKLDFPPADAAAGGEAPPPAALDARVEPLAYDISGVDPRRVSVIDAANDKSYATVLMIVPSDKVRGSHDSEGRPTPGFNPELQQRGSSREGAAFVNQRQKITTGFKAGIVTEIPRDPTKGVSIVESPTPYPDGTFQLAGGNIRKSAEDWIAQNQPEGVAGKADSLQALYDQRRAAARAAGISEAEIAAAGDAPFLVRAIVSDLKDPTGTFKTRAAYAAYLSNKPAIASMSSTERATEIGRFITPDMLTAFQIKEGQNLEAAVADPDNAAILQKIKSKLLPVELSGLMSENNVTTYGKQIIAAAIFQKAYPSASGERIAAAILNDTAASVGDSNIAAGMMKTLRSTLELETQIRTGQLPADLSITPEVSRALDAFEYARQHPSNKRTDSDNKRAGAADTPLATKIDTALNAAMDMFASADEAAQFSPTEKSVALVMALNRESPNQIASFIDQYNALALQQREMGAALTKEGIITKILADNLQREKPRVTSDTIAELRGALKSAKKQGYPDAVQQAQNELDSAMRLREEQKNWPAPFKSPADLLLDTKPRDQRAYLPPKEGDAPLTGEKPAEAPAAKKPAETPKAAPAVKTAKEASALLPELARDLALVEYSGDPEKVKAATVAYQRARLESGRLTLAENEAKVGAMPPGPMDTLVRGTAQRYIDEATKILTDLGVPLTDAPKPAEKRPLQEFVVGVLDYADEVAARESDGRVPDLRYIRNSADNLRALGILRDVPGALALGDGVIAAVEKAINAPGETADALKADAARLLGEAAKKIRATAESGQITQVNDRPISMAETRPGTTAQQVADGQAALESIRQEAPYADDPTMTPMFETVAPEIDKVLNANNSRLLSEAQRAYAEARPQEAIDQITQAVLDSLYPPSPDFGPMDSKLDVAQLREIVTKTVVSRLSGQDQVRPGVRKVATGQDIQYLGLRTSYEGMVANGSAPIVGMRVSGGDEMAVLGTQVMRNPKVEYMHLVFVAGDRIVGDVIPSQRLPGAVNFDFFSSKAGGTGDIYDWIRIQAEQHGADGVWDLHNHPTADPSPSDADKRSSGEFDRQLGKLFKGSIVIDSDAYEIRLNGESDPEGNAVYTKKFLDKALPKQFFDVYDQMRPLRMSIEGDTTDIVEGLAQEGNRIANLAWTDSGARFAVVVGAQMREVTGISYIRDPRNYLDSNRRDAAVRSFMRATGADFATVVYPPNAGLVEEGGVGAQGWVRDTERQYTYYDTWGGLVDKTATKHVANWESVPAVDRLQAIVDAHKAGDITATQAKRQIAELSGAAYRKTNDITYKPSDLFGPSRLAARTPEEEAQAIRDAQAKREQERYAGVPDALGARNAKGLADLRAAGTGKPSSPLALDAAKWAVDTGKTTISADDIQTQFKITQPEAAQVWQELRARGVIDATGDIIPAAPEPAAPPPTGAEPMRVTPEAADAALAGRPMAPPPAAAPPIDFTLPSDLAGAKPNYGYRGENYKLNFASDYDRAAYILANDAKSGKSRAADRYEKALKAAGLDPAEAVAHGRKVRDAVKGMASDFYDSPDGAGEINVPDMGAPQTAAGGAGGRLPPKPPGPPPPAEPPDPMSIDPDAQTPENIALQESSLHNEGDHEAPRFEDMAKAAHTEQQAALEAFRKAVEDYASKPLPEGALSPEAQAAIFRAEDETIKKFNSTFDAAKTYARSSTNFTLLDYAQKRGFDTWLSAIAPFSYWATRQGRNFALRLMQNPAYLTAYLRFKQDLEAENRRRGTRSRFSGSVKIPLQDLSRGKLNDIYVDPIEVFLPFAGLMGQDVTDPQGQMTGVQQVYTMAERLGLRPSPAIDIPLRASGALQADNSPEQAAQWGKGSIGAFTPQGGLIQGVTSALGIGGPGGVNIEEPIRNAIGLPDTGAYDPYRYGRSVSDISASLNAMQGPGMDPRPFLAAQEWIGKHKDSDLAKQLRQATPAEVAAELNIDPKLAALALEAARAGAKQASQQRAVAQIGSSMLGLRLQELPQGEQIRTGMADAERGAAYSPMTGVGSREQVKAVQDQYPALQVQRGQYQALPGDSRDSSYLFDNAQKKVVNQAFDGLAANVLAARPWDRRATRLVEDARYTALAHTERKASTTPGDWQAEYQRALAKIAGGDSVTANAPNLAYRPLSVAGASPAEATQMRQQEAMRAIVRTQPRAEAFTGPDGQIDFTSYNSARDAWEKALPTISKGIPEVFAIVGQADKEGRGAALRAWLDKLGPDQLDEYRRRSDTPLEAAQRTYFEGVYQPAMDAYRKASDLGVPDAWNTTVGQVGTLRGSDLIPQIQQVYGNRFTPDELASLKTLTFPPAVDVMRANMSESAKAKDGARSAFWDYMNTATPPGSPAYNLRQIPLIASALDQSSRSTVTAEQYTQALQMARGWVAENYGQPTPKQVEEWNTARAAKKSLDNLILVELGQEGAIALRAYQSATAAADKEAVRRSNPLVQKALNLQALFARKNPVFARYYKSAARGAGIAKITRR